MSLSLIKNLTKFTVIVAFFLSSIFYANAGVVNDLKEKISNRATSIENLEKEIAQQRLQLDEIGHKKTSLQKTVKILDISRNRIKTNINITKNKIETSGLNINKLNLQIKKKEKNISTNMEQLKNAIQVMNEIDGNTLVELMLSSNDVSSYWDQTERMGSLQRSLNNNINKLRNIKKVLEFNKKERGKEKKKLLKLKDGLEDQKKIADQNRIEKNSLLRHTKNKESNYKKLLKEKKEIKKQFEQELLDFESQLQFALDPNKLPQEGSRVLAWPLDNIYITQQFGYTNGGKRLYKNGWHNGTDFRARTPKKIKSPASGVVIGTGNTDLTCRGASFGKWVLIKHYNGLSTLFAHMSLIKVSKGQKIMTSDIVGYTGNTGYSTAAHLHMGLYASGGVSVKQLPSKACGGRTYTLPLAAHSAYLDPLAYLPKLQ